MDTTVAGSRNGVTPLILWSAIQRWGEEGFRKRALRCLEVAEYAVTRFTAAGVTAWRHQNSVTVVLPRPTSDVIRRWQIAPMGEIAHIITMAHVTRAVVDSLVAEVTGAGRK